MKRLKVKGVIEWLRGGGGVYVCDHNVIALGNLVIATRCISLLSLSQKPQSKKTVYSSITIVKHFLVTSSSFSMWSIT